MGQVVELKKELGKSKKEYYTTELNNSKNNPKK